MRSPLLDPCAADFLADKEHRHLVPLALAYHNGAVDRHRIERPPHRLDRCMVGPIRIAHAHGARRRNGRVFPYV
jgi:hypothetical protein